MREVLAGSPRAVRVAAERVAAGEVIPDEDAEAIVDALAEAMLSNEGYDSEALTPSGVQIDEIIGIIQQMSQHFYG
jgi:hypothetical protein